MYTCRVPNNRFGCGMRHKTIKECIDCIEIHKRQTGGADHYIPFHVNDLDDPEKPVLVTEYHQEIVELIS